MVQKTVITRIKNLRVFVAIATAVIVAAVVIVVATVVIVAVVVITASFCK